MWTISGRLVDIGVEVKCCFHLRADVFCFCRDRVGGSVPVFHTATTNSQMFTAKKVQQQNVINASDTPRVSEQRRHCTCAGQLLYLPRLWIFVLALYFSSWLKI